MKMALLKVIEKKKIKNPFFSYSFVKRSGVDVIKFHYGRNLWEFFNSML